MEASSARAAGIVLTGNGGHRLSNKKEAVLSESPPIDLAVYVNTTALLASNESLPDPCPIRFVVPDGTRHECAKCQNDRRVIWAPGADGGDNT
jgi:hypothetical protein